jgi:hypothetical protein
MRCSNAARLRLFLVSALSRALVTVDGFLDWICCHLIHTAQDYKFVITVVLLGTEIPALEGGVSQGWKCSTWGLSSFLVPLNNSGIDLTAIFLAFLSVPQS